MIFYLLFCTQIGFVNAGVSVLNSASHILLNKRIRKLETHWDKRIKDLTKTNTKFKRCKFFFFIDNTGNQSLAVKKEIMPETKGNVT